MVFGFFKKNKKEEEDSSLVSSDPTVLDIKKGWTIDFYDSFILKGFPLENFNILEEGPYEVVGANKTTYTTEYTLRGGKGDAILEVEKKGGRNILLIQTGLESYPSLLPAMRKAWKRDCDEFEFKGVKYYLVDSGEEEDDGEECDYWDYYSDPINDGNKLFIGVQDYGDPGDAELEFYVGFEIPERSVKEIVPA
ncbi:MAG: DUF4178 domain-containing protein [Deltaproteobacteria bacterium]|nr:DUF4178 domain-containing protein [Deltaproteobacteria bacterium]